jgi:UDP-N-acetylmuramate dehydrogenase
VADLRREFESEMGNDYRGEVVFGEMLSKHTSLSIGGPADIYVIPADAVSLKRCLMFANERKIAVVVLSGGTNVIISDNGIRGMVISLKNFNMIKALHETNDSAELFVESGVPLQKLVNYCIENGYAGIEGLSGIPGTLGGAIFGNAGSFGQEIKDVIASLVVINRSGMIKRLGSKEFSFGYRRSNLGEGLIVLSANMIFGKADAASIREKAADYISRKKNTQPTAVRSAGCVYKNPVDDSAGRLIEKAGCKGLRVGDIEVSDVHANYFINRGKGTASEFLELMKMVEKKVVENTGIHLEPEVRIISDGY